MQRFLLRLCALLIIVVTSVVSLQAQEDTSKPTSVDPKLLDWENARIPREYTIGKISITGIRFLDTAIVLSISSLQPGDKFMHPGSDIFAKAIANLWRQKLFSEVQVYVTAIQDDKIDIELNVVERPRLGNFKFEGIKKTEAEELQGKIGLAKQTIITENIRRNIVEVTSKYYRDKGFENINVRIEERPDPAFANSNQMIIHVDKGKKVRVDEINYFDNNQVKDLKLKKQMKGTKEMTKITLYPSTYQSSYGNIHRPSFKQYFKDWGFLSFSKTKEVLDP
ncbi:MAG TPA: POTRA domain-containing protein, partial [Chitinophagaceae bacterium]|nr:POTRA domain-containing protein [Chitinophagaceae bacterium]